MESDPTFTPLPNNARYEYSILDRPIVGQEPDVRVYVRVKEEETEEKAPGTDPSDKTTDDEEIEIKEETDDEDDERESEERLIIVTEVGTGRGDENQEPTVYASLNLNDENGPSEDVTSTPGSDSSHEHQVCVLC